MHGRVCPCLAVAHRVIAVIVVADQPELEHVVRRVAVHQVLQGARQHDGHRAAVQVPHRKVPRIVRLRAHQKQMNVGSCCLAACLNSPDGFNYDLISEGEGWGFRIFFRAAINDGSDDFCTFPLHTEQG